MLKFLCRLLSSAALPVTAALTTWATGYCGADVAIISIVVMTGVLLIHDGE